MTLLPFSYALRNLFRDPSRLLLTVGGSFLVVLLLVAAVAFNQGMNNVLATSGSPKNIILLGSGSEESIERSEVPLNAESVAATSIPGLEAPLGVPAVSGEIFFQSPIETESGDKNQAILRGVSEKSLLVHSKVTLIEGRFPGPGEAMVGKLAHRKLGVDPSELAVGKSIYFGREELKITGIFSAPGTVLESEIWLERSDLATFAQRDTLSSVTLKIDDADLDDVEVFTLQRNDLELVAIPETTYYAKLATFYQPIQLMTWVTALLVAAGAIFGGLNTIYAAFASRIREMATLQSIGFGRTALFISITQESLLTTMTGTLIALISAYLLIDGISVPFSIGTFTLSLTPTVILAGLITGLILGLLGTIPPAIRCLSPSLPKSLRSS